MQRPIRTKISRKGSQRMPQARSNANPSSKPARKQAPVATALRRYTTADPQLQSSGSQIRVSHREFIQDVAGSVAFSATSFPINPGRDALFTWLPDLATRYERYQFVSLKFLYEPRCPTSTAGTIILSIDYDPLDAAPTSKQDVYSYHHSAQSSAWDECCLSVDATILRNRGTLYNRPGAIPTGSDLKSYDLGNLWLCTSGFAGATVCGELFVEYTVELKIPQVQSNVQQGILTATTPAKASPLGTGTTMTSGLLDASHTTTTLTFNQNFTGIAIVRVAGTVLNTGGYTNAGTATITMGGFLTEIVNAAATLYEFQLDCQNVLRGQTWIPDFTSTTVTAFQVMFIQTS